MRVLIADDAPLLRSRLARLIHAVPGVDAVLESSDFAQTLGMIRAERPDAVVLDLFMPGGTGLDILREIEGEAGRPRVIVLTAWGDEELRARCIAAGAEHFFEKGAHFLSAVEAVEAMVAQRAAAANETIAPPRDEPAAQPDSAPRALTVLIVEDHELQRRILANIVRASGGTQVLEAGDGVEALKILRHAGTAVDLILCDLDMPNMDGMEFMRHLGDSGTSAGLVIISTLERAVLNSVQTMCLAYGLRPLGVLEKPVDPDRLRAILNAGKAPRAARLAAPSDVGLRFTLEQILEGIEQRQFEPFFQAKVDVASGRIVGAEALARWRHPELGVIPPLAFVEPLESSGNIDALTFQMLDQAAAACRGWRDRGLELGVSVNLSLVSLADTLLAERIDARVRENGLEARHVTLEVTETAAMTDVASALENLARLRMRGFGLSIDDYGTGFASMQLLGRVAFTELKIDRGFVSAMAEKHEARAIVESSIDMARRLGIQSVAEGIETGAEVAALRAAGCDLAQGYFYSRPIAAPEFLAYCVRAGA